MECDAPPAKSRSDPCLITDLRDVPLGKLAKRAADAEGTRASVVDRVMKSAGDPVRVQALTFNSAV
jgi:hypothetical protein